MVEVILSFTVGFLIGLPVGAFALIGWVNRYTQRQASIAQETLDKLNVMLTHANETHSGPTRIRQ
jgi:hypothetical protein